MGSVIKVTNLHKRYKEHYAVRGVSFEVEKGEIFGILGPNGAGKTTTIEMLEGLRPRDEGEIEILGIDPDQDPYGLRQLIGIQFQSTSIQDRMKVGEALRLFASFYKRKADMDHIVEKLGLKEYLNNSFESLSGGWKQRLTLALALLHDPDIVFLDEPSTGLDPKARRDLWNLILEVKGRGKTIVLTTHYMEEAEQLCDRIAMFRHGELVALDTPMELKKQLTASQVLMFSSREAEESMIVPLPSVEKVEVEEMDYKVYSDNLQQTTLHLLQQAEREGWKIEGLRFAQATLDDLFLDIEAEEEIS
ncbi:ABC transporter ATP-binding protein [Mechercharimyces sp. CAU 1602]|uniref:ABC transporter ATP-binding protein n=1 Tax=Mechercharimyces sp. CAU 1602 TaxID=2973933 RepID=UPI002162161D|nr:ABC transporter ATP-binding protein [Mechercharimyces sp. CAU 1602]MCS1350074.1 ABC transporter ATP-binding protein [Mechercharimyces sp. CAU 1602]